MTFLGSWLVSEYVYNPDSTFAGIVRQRRELQRLGNGRIRVIQQCQPEETLATHPMAHFAGEWVFDLSVDGRFRRYHGPAVIGSGTTWRDGVMTGRGMWPEFGHNFRSFSIMLNPACQLTGGKFFNGSEMVANIVGVAVPETDEATYPLLNQAYLLPPHSKWAGTAWAYLPDGTPHGEQQTERIFHQMDASGFYWEESGKMTELRAKNGRLLAPNAIGKQFGPLLEIESADENGRFCEQMELLDAMRGQLVGFTRWYQDDQLERVEIVGLGNVE